MCIRCFFFFIFYKSEKCIERNIYVCTYDIIYFLFNFIVLNGYLCMRLFSKYIKKKIYQYEI